MSDLFPPTRDEIVSEMSRELQTRRKVFPRWVAEGKLKQDVADKRLACMQAGYDWIVKCLHDHPECKR